MKLHVDLNADLGEGAGHDEEDQHHAAKRGIVDTVEEAETEPRSEEHRRGADEIARDRGGGENPEAREIDEGRDLNRQDEGLHHAALNILGQTAQAAPLRLNMIQSPTRSSKSQTRPDR